MLIHLFNLVAPFVFSFFSGCFFIIGIVELAENNPRSGILSWIVAATHMFVAVRIHP